MQNKIQKLQNREARVLTCSNYDAKAGHLFELLRWKNLASQQQIQRTMMVYKSLHRLAPDYLYSKFERQETAHNLRDSENKLNVPLLQTNYYKNSFSYSGATLWNRLPRDIRQAESLGLFTCLIKEVCSGTAFVESSFSHCLEAWNINSAHAPLNRDDDGLLPDAYLHLVRKKAAN